MNKKPKIIIDKKRLRPLKSEIFNLKCDNKKIKKLTKWKIKTDFNSGLKKTVNWFEKNKSSYLNETYHE